MTLEATEILVYEWMGLPTTSKLAGALHFFIYDTIKILGLLAVMIFVIGVLRTWLPEERLRAWMNRRGWWGYLVAALFGIATPFCSCSSIPLFIGLLRTRVPLGVAFAFLITSPLVNEYLVILMIEEFGWRIAMAYVLSGMAIGVLGGAVIARLKFEKELEQDFVEGTPMPTGTAQLSLKDRLRIGFQEARHILKSIWKWVLLGVGIGALIHNYVPEATLHGAMEAAGVFSVPLATLLGVPLYGSCAAVVPVAAVLFAKGIPLGTALAFMMAMAALSLPEAIMLRRAMRLKLIVLFFGVTAAGIMVIGYALNALSWLLID